MSKDKAEFRHIYTQRNPMYEHGLVNVGFRSCLLKDNAEINSTEKAHFQVETEPKYVSSFRKTPINDFGDLNHKESTIYTSNSHKATNGRVVNKLWQFADHYQPLYKEREVSLAMVTLTTANDVYALKGMTMRKMMDNVKYRYESISHPIRGYIWVSEVSETYHWHYHLLLAFDRMNIRGKGIPNELKFDDVWGARTEFEFVKRSVRAYLSKYMTKNQLKISGMRRYGASKTWK